MRFKFKTIGQKLLAAFSGIALLVGIAAGIGIAGLSLVAKTQHAVVDSALPALNHSRALAEQTARIIMTAQALSQTNDTKALNQHQQTLTRLFGQNELTLASLQAYPFSRGLLTQIEQTHEQVRKQMNTLNDEVALRLQRQRMVNNAIAAQQRILRQMEGLVQAQVSNADAVAMANFTQLYDLVHRGNTQQTLSALDRLIEVDLDVNARLLNMRYLIAVSISLLDEVRQPNLSENRIDALAKQYQNNVDKLKLRLVSIEDPNYAKQLSSRIEQLAQFNSLFDQRRAMYRHEQEIEKLSQQAVVHFHTLSDQVAELSTAANAGTTFALEQVAKTITRTQATLIALSVLGVLVVIWVMWQYVYARIIRRISRAQRALTSIADGELSIHLKAEGDDELAAMERAIIVARDTAKAKAQYAAGEKRAREALQNHQASLEATIAERTEALRLANAQLAQEVDEKTIATKAAEQANQAKSAFLATMSHEIRTPLNGVLGIAALLDNDELSEKQKNYVSVIRKSGETLLELVTDILDFSKIESGHLDIHPSPFSLAHLLDDVITLFMPRAQEKGLQLAYHCDAALCDYWLGDMMRIRQVLNNLVSNAIKYTEQGQVQVLVHEHEGMLCFAVKDTGVGIDDVQQAQLFQPFYQTDSGRQTTGGTGLGLAIAARIVGAMGGHIAVQSQRFQGSSFSLYLPLEPAQAPEQITPMVSQTAPELSGRLTSLQVLVVEDNAVNRLVIEGYLERLGCHYVMAEDGATALHLAAQQSFDLALLDINLPDTDGVTLRGELMHTQPSLYSIAVSAHVYDEEVARFYTAGFDAVVPKPVRFERLHQALLQMVSGYHGAPLVAQAQQHGFDANAHLIFEREILEQDLPILGLAVIENLVTVFEQSSEQTLANLAQALDQQDQATISQYCHQLKGAAFSLGLASLAQCCAYYEHEAAMFDTDVMAQLLQLRTQSLDQMQAFIAEKNGG